MPQTKIQLADGKLTYLMDQAESQLDEASLATLLWRGRTVFSRAAREALVRAGYTDLPSAGLSVINAIKNDGVPLGQLISELGVTKQAAGQLVDILASRGYLARGTNPRDRRKLIVNLTERGRAAAVVQRDAAEKIETELLSRLGPDHLAKAREMLALLDRIGFGNAVQA